jgi:hypothetical protein
MTDSESGSSEAVTVTVTAATTTATTQDVVLDTHITATTEAGIENETEHDSNVNALQVRVALESLRNRVGKLLQDNSSATELCHLDPLQLTINEPMRNELESEANSSAEAFRATLTRENVAKQLLVHRISQECQAAMQVHRMAISAIKNPETQVTNFTIPKVTPDEERRMKKIRFLRRMQMMENTFMAESSAAVADDSSDNGSQSATGASSMLASEQEFAARSNPPYLVSGLSITAEIHGLAHHVAKMDGSQSSSVNSLTGTAGAHGSSHGPGNSGGSGLAATDSSSTWNDVLEKAREASLLYDTVSCTTMARCISQMHLILEQTHQTMIAFNRKFNGQLERKRRCLDEINARHRAIIDASEEAFVLELDEKERVDAEAERQERLATLQQEAQRVAQMSWMERKLYEKRQKQKKAEDESSAKSSKIISDASDAAKQRELQVMRANCRAEMELKYPIMELGNDGQSDVLALAAGLKPAGTDLLQANSDNKDSIDSKDDETSEDNLPARALQDMMGGTLKTDKAGLDRLSKVLQREPWMNEVPQSEMTDEQKQELAVFERKEKEIIAEREAHLRMLHSEIKRLQSEVIEFEHTFDEQVSSLLHQRLQMCRTIFQQDMIVIHNLTLVEGVRHSMRVSNTDRKSLVEYLQRQDDILLRREELHSALVQYSKELEALEFEQKALDKRDYFRRDFLDAGFFVDTLFKLYRAKRGPKSATDILDGQSNLSTQDITNAVVTRYGEILSEDRPEELTSDEVWSRMLKRRQAKIDTVIQIEARRQRMEASKAEYAMLGEEWQEVTDAFVHGGLAWLEQEDFVRSSQLDSTAYFELRSGLVEVAGGPLMHDDSDCIMVDRAEIQELNTVIRHFNDEKVSILRDIRDFRKGILSLQWRDQMRGLKLDELAHRNTELQLLRVTKSLQNMIKLGGQDRLLASEHEALEQKCDHTQRAINMMKQQNSTRLEKVNHKIRQMQAENKRLQRHVADLTKVVQSREAICLMLPGSAAQLLHNVTRSNNINSNTSGSGSMSARRPKGSPEQKESKRNSDSPLKRRMVQQLDIAKTAASAGASDGANSASGAQTERLHRNRPRRSGKQAPTSPAAQEAAARHQKMYMMNMLRNTTREQGQAISLLSAERDRLRQRTYPIFNSDKRMEMQARVLAKSPNDIVNLESIMPNESHHARYRQRSSVFVKTPGSPPAGNFATPHPPSSPQPSSPSTLPSLR